MRWFYYTLLTSGIAVCFACKPDPRRAEAARVATEWIGKTVTLPSDIPCYRISKEMRCTYAAPYKLLLYVDSMGCISCGLKLFLWESILAESDSLFAGELDFVFYFQPKRGKEKELKFLLKRDRLDVPVFFDREGKLDRLNQLPKNTDFQCFLLDSSNRVLSIGNPSLNPKIWELYKEVITGKKATPQEKQTAVEVENSEHEFGEIKTGESSIAVFQLKNTGEYPLIISRVATSCGCASAEWERQPVAAGQATAVTVAMKPEEAGFFSKTAAVHCNAKGSPIRLTVSGTASSR